MRLAIIILVALLTLPCNAQERVFHASSIDIEQNDRLDAIEARLAKLDAAKIVPDIPTQAPSQKIDPPAIVLAPPVKQSLVVPTQAVWGNQAYNHPLCNSPTCAMCNSIRAQLQPRYIQTKPEIDYEIVQVPVVQRVKHCNGRTCWYENVTTYRTERRPIRRAAQAAVNLLRMTELVPMPQDAVAAMLSVVEPTQGEVLYDLGCGDGRVLVAATAKYGCRSVGVELNTATFKLAAERVDSAGLADKIKLYQGDVLSYSYPEADVVTMYLYPELMAKVLKKLRRGTRVVSYLHPIPGGVKHVVNNHTFYTWVVQ